jgi:hypothetical protein
VCTALYTYAYHDLYIHTYNGRSGFDIVAARHAHRQGIVLFPIPKKFVSPGKCFSLWEVGT